MKSYLDSISHLGDKQHFSDKNAMFYLFLKIIELKEWQREGLPPTTYLWEQVQHRGVDRVKARNQELRFDLPYGM